MCQMIRNDFFQLIGPGKVLSITKLLNLTPKHVNPQLMLYCVMVVYRQIFRKMPVSWNHFIVHDIETC